MSSNIFHDYDIRGRYPSEVNEAVFYNLGEAFWQVFKPGKVAIGRDARLSSDTLFLYLASGLKKNGVKVIDLGRVSTPFCVWYTKHYKTDTLVVTASHNPKDFNGLKIYSHKRGPIDKNSGLLKIKEKFDSLNFNPGAVDLKKSIFKKHQPFDEYVRFCAKNFKISKSKIKSVIDFSNGITGREYIAVLDKLKANFTTLNETPNGNFPAHEPNPLSEESQKAIKVFIKSKKTDFGAVIDGDGDRIVFFDDKGEPVEPSYLFSMLIDYFADPRKNKAVVRTAALSKIIDETAKAKGFKTIITKVGHTYVQRAMEQNKAQIGGEKSGHYFFKNAYYGDTTLFAFLAVLKVLTSAKKPLSELLSPYKKYIILPEINYPFYGKIDKIMGEVKEKFRGGKISELDGISVDFPDPAKLPKGDSGASYHFNLRKSNTAEGVWRLTLEGPSREKLNEIKKEIEKILE